MALYASTERAKKGLTKARQNITSAQTIEGADCIWNISTAAASYDVTVESYDATRYNQYLTVQSNKVQPTLIIKCAVDTSANNVAIKSSDGAGGMTTHYTFAADYSVTPRYIALRISSTLGADGKYLWEIA